MYFFLHTQITNNITFDPACRHLRPALQRHVCETSVRGDVPRAKVARSLDHVRDLGRGSRRNPANSRVWPRPETTEDGSAKRNIINNLPYARAIPYVIRLLKTAGFFFLYGQTCIVLRLAVRWKSQRKPVAETAGTWTAKRRPTNPVSVSSVLDIRKSLFPSEHANRV